MIMERILSSLCRYLWVGPVWTHASLFPAMEKTELSYTVFDWCLFSSCRICFIDILFQISGTFQVNIPPVLLGYTWSKTTYVSPREDCNGQNLKECTFLNIFATIEPQISYTICNPELDKVGFTLGYFYMYYQRSVNFRAGKNELWFLIFSCGNKMVQSWNILNLILVFRSHRCFGESTDF